jgi:MscS family membrane protein
MRVFAWFETPDWGEFLMIRHRLLLEFMRTVERHGSSFAFPSRTVYHVTQDTEPSTAELARGDATRGSPSRGVAPPGTSVTE